MLTVAVSPGDRASLSVVIINSNSISAGFGVAVNIGSKVAVGAGLATGVTMGAPLGCLPESALLLELTPALPSAAHRAHYRYSNPLFHKQSLNS